MNEPVTHRSPGETIVCIKGAGEMASGIAWRLFRSGFRKIFMLEVARPLAVRRTVSFCEAIHDRRISVEGVDGVSARSKEGILSAWADGHIAVCADPDWSILPDICPHVVVDAILAKKNLGTRRDEAERVIGCGPGFTAGRDVHFVVETQRGHDLGRVIETGMAAPNTGIPGDIGGHTTARVLRAPAEGVFKSDFDIGEMVTRNQVIGQVNGTPVFSAISGVLRGLIRPGTEVSKSVKIGDVDPRGIKSYCFTLSDKARAIAGGVLEAVMR